MNTLKIRKPVRTVVLTLLILLITTLAVAGAIVLFSSHVFREGEVTAGSIGTEAKVEFSAQSAQTSLVFTAGGEQHPIALSIKNSTPSHLRFRYEITHNASSDLASAILVHYDGRFIGTLGELCSIGDGNVGSAEIGHGFVELGTTDTSHTLTLELHEATPASYYDGKALTLTLTAYTESIDHQKYLFVTNENELARAVDDVNSGMLADPCIVLGRSVTLTRSYALTHPATLELDGHSLELGGNTLTLCGAGRFAITSLSPAKASALSSLGSIVLDHDEALLDIADFFAQNGTNVGALYGALVRLQRYDADAASSLLLERMEQTFAHGVYAGDTVQLFGALSFYIADLEASAEFGALMGGSLALPDAALTAQCRVTVNGTSKDLKVIGTNDSALEQIKQGVLAHLPTDSYEKITSDVFLPSSVPALDATITWMSSDEDTITPNGEISDVVKDNAPVTLYAYIRINDTVYTESYSFHVSSQNNETKFSYLVAQLSPIFLDTVFARDEDKGTDNGILSHHYLPVVNDGSDYDYRHAFSTPEARPSPYVWFAYKDIGLEKLEYSVSTTYNYVSVQTDQNGDTYAYLNSAVFYDYAQINLKGTFKNGEVYEGIVNVTISLGDDADLQNKVFRFIESTLGEIDVLQNILDTRVAEGMLYERGDFYLPSRYMTYTVSYSIPASSVNVISGIVAPGASYGNGQINESEMYLIRVDPAYFYSSETAVGLNISIKPESLDIGGEARILYFTVPPVIKPDESGFNNLGVFNAVKYQIFQQLPDAEREGATGFTLTSTSLQNKTGAYILCRDAAFATTLTLYVTKDSVSTDNSKIYTLMRLIEWATSKDTLSASSIWSSGGSTLSDGNEFLTAPEITVIKNYWRSATGSVISDTLWNTVFQRAIGRVITNGDVLNGYIKNIGLDAATYFKYVEMLNFALDKQNFGTTAGGQWAGSPPNLGTLKRQYTFNGDGTYTLDATASDYKNSKYYKQSYYQEDQSPYISEAEAELLRALVLNLAAGKNTTAATNAGNSYVQAFDQYVVIPTYLNAGGIGLLTKAFYEALGTDAANFTSQVTSFGGYNVPSVANLDNSLTALQYLTGLTRLYIYGQQPSGTDSGLAAFLSTSGLSGFFNLITSVNQSFTHLEMMLVARNYVSFDVTFTERLINLTHLNYSHNAGITNVGPLVNLPIENLQYLNIAGVDVSFEFSDYVMSNVHAATNGAAEIYYFPDGSETLTRYAHDGAVDDSLTYLNEIGQIKSEYLQLCPSIITGEGNKDIYWRVESGNMMTYVTVAGELASIPAVENYYYCTASFDGFIAGHIYALNKNGTGYFIDLGAYVAVQGIPDTITFTDAEKANDKITNSNSNDEETILSETIEYNANITQTLSPAVSGTKNNNRTLTITLSNGQKATFNNARGYGCARKIQKTVTREITVLRTNTDQWLKTNSYYNEATGEVVTATYQLTATTELTQTYTETVTYWYCDFYYTLRENNSNVNYYFREAGYADWTEFKFDGNTVYRNPKYVDESKSQVGALSENDFTLVPGGSSETVTRIGQTTIISPVGQLSSATRAQELRQMMSAAISGGVYYLYTGNDRTVNYYNNSTTRAKQFSFARNTAYSASTDANGFISWTANATVSASVGTGGMDAILAEANLHINDPLYGMYYGMYYAYNGAAFVTLSGNVYQPTYIYRLLFDEERGCFYFEHDNLEKMGIKNTFTVVQSIDEAGGLLEKSLQATEKNVGDIYYYASTSDDNYFHQPNIFYVITRSETGDYFAKTFGCVDAVFEQEANGSYTLRFQNQRIFYGASSNSNLYSGTGGTEYAVISAVVETDDGMALRKFRVKITG